MIHRRKRLAPVVLPEQLKQPSLQWWWSGGKYFFINASVPRKRSSVFELRATSSLENRSAVGTAFLRVTDSTLYGLRRCYRVVHESPNKVGLKSRSAKCSFLVECQCFERHCSLSLGSLRYVDSSSVRVFLCLVSY